MQSPVETAPEVDARSAVVLVVDDEPAIRRFVVRTLQKDGISVVEAGDGPSALEAFAAEPDRFDALFCDLSLPDVSGEEVVRTVRAARPALPVVVMTGWDPGTAAEGIGPVGPLEWLPKPFSISTIQEIIRKVHLAR